MNMKKLISLLLTICMVWFLVACGNGYGNDELQAETPPTAMSLMETEQQKEANHQEEIPKASDVPFEGKIAIITSESGDDFQVARYIEERYGEDRIIHRIWSSELYVMNLIIDEFINDSDIKTIVVGWAPVGTNVAFEKLRETRDDIFVVFCTPAVLGAPTAY